MIIDYVQQDFIEYIKYNGRTAVAHNCNCFHAMGTGIAKTLDDYTNGKLKAADKQTSYGDINKLGEFSFVEHHGIIFFNLYGMFVYRTLLKSNYRGTFVNWKMLQHSMTNAIIDSQVNDLTIPVMGCSHAGGRVDDFITMINELSENIDKFNNQFKLTILSK